MNKSILLGALLAISLGVAANTQPPSLDNPDPPKNCSPYPECRIMQEQQKAAPVEVGYTNPRLDLLFGRKKL